MKKKLAILITFCFGIFTPTLSYSKDDVYMGFPVTVQGYGGDKTDSTSYSGQIARHLLHNSLKKLVGKGNGQSNENLKMQMMAYYSGKTKDGKS